MTVRSLTQTGASNSLLRGEHASPASWTPTFWKVSSALLVRIFFSVVDTNTGDGPKFVSDMRFFLTSMLFGIHCLVDLTIGFPSSETYALHTLLIIEFLHLISTAILSNFFFKEKIYSIECWTQDPVTVRFGTWLLPSQPAVYIWLENAWLPFISVQASSLDHPKLCTLLLSLNEKAYVVYKEKLKASV